MEWTSRPFVHLLIFFVAGILLAGLFPGLERIPHKVLYLLLALTLIADFLIALYFRSFAFKWVTGIVFGISLISAGMVLTLLKKGRAEPQKEVTGTYWRAEVASDPVIKQKSVRLIALVRPLSGQDTFAVSGTIKALLVFESDSSARTLSPGNILLIHARLRRPRGAQNPMAFDYAEFLKNRGVYYTAFVPSENWKKTGENAHGILYAALRLRQRLLNVLHENGLSGKEYAVASAVLLGYGQMMDPETEREYQAAGAVHVLCVSGLHVGIIYLVFGFLFSFLGEKRRGRRIKALLLLTVIWFYALLTGLSPSVWRAAVMISLFIIGENLRRDKDKYNTLAASAFILLAINPLLVYDVGFQLSYAAVFGILLFYRPVYGLLFFKNRVADLVWSVMALSVSAQAGAFPVAAHYFHTFPLYFLLTNLLVFGLAYIVVTLGMLFIIVSPLPWIAAPLGKVLYASVYLMNYLVGLVASLPRAQISNLYFPWIKVLFVYGIIFGLFLWAVKKEGKYFIVLLLSILLLLSFNTMQKFERLGRKEMVVYALNKGLAVDFIHGTHHLFLADSTAAHQKKALLYAAGNYHIACGLSDRLNYMEKGYYNTPYLFYDSGFFGTGTYTGLIVEKKETAFPFLKRKPQIDYLILNAPYGNSLSDISRAVKFRQVVLANNPRKSYRKKILQEAMQMKIPVYDMKKKGFFSVSR